MAGMEAPWWATIYVIVPIFSGFVWLGMLLGMLLWWSVTENSVHLVGMSETQDIAYISDIGAHQLQPLFIAMGTVTVVGFTTVFVTERWLRHRGTIAPNTSRFQKVLSALAIIFAVIGMIGLIILTCRNNIDYSTTHDEYQRLGIHYRQHRILRLSFWIKLTFIFVELGLAIAFGVLGHQKRYNPAAVCEWVISLIYTFYVWSYAIDFIPAIRTKHYASKETEIDMAEGMEAESRMRGYPGGVPQEQAAYGSTGATRGQESRNF
ncbi:Frag1/DRAM/Sfk1 family-domain-containing protein [Leptodontidium sp. MPI-SDFR-AT-0119]|nr:Frag1/DRAM/Sfk1 family-domain-containing protein [Leptodontidium sp. MPI-SDFR-AT-0119]